MALSVKKSYWGKLLIFFFFVELSDKAFNSNSGLLISFAVLFVNYQKYIFSLLLREQVEFYISLKWKLQKYL